jgi:hypothetical protein
MDAAPARTRCERVDHAGRFEVLVLQRAERVDREVVSGRDAAVRAAERLKRDPRASVPAKGRRQPPM